MTKASSPKMLSRSAAALLERAQAYATLINRELSTVSSYLFNDGKVLKSLSEGGDIMTRALDRANDELDRRTAMLQAGAHAPAPAMAPKPKPKPKAPAKKAVAMKAAKVMVTSTRTTKWTPPMDARAHPSHNRQPAQAAAAKPAPKQTAPAAPAKASKSGK